jgi:chemotaxis protein methyltransferase CheR
MAIAEKERQWLGWRFDIVATDFADDALSKAHRGIYSQFEVQRGLPVALLVKHFQKVGMGWEIRPEMRAKIEFRAHNLLDDCRDLGICDVIFCRNVLIYFDEATRAAVLARLTAQLASDGYLVLGAAETATGTNRDLMPVPELHHGIFCLTPDAAMRARARHAQKEGGMAGANGSSGNADVQLASIPPTGASPIRAIKLDKHTADQLEALALARGLSVAELLAEFVACGNTPALKPKQARAG